MNTTTRTKLIKALKLLELGDPVEAVSILEMALQDDATFDQHKLIEKAHDEASLGSPDKAETLLQIALDTPDQGRELRWTAAAVMGRLGGLARSVKKTEAARRNARLTAGRPRPNARKKPVAPAGGG